MKRTLFLILILLFVAGCGTNNNAQEENQETDVESEDIVSDNEETENNESVNVDKGLLSVEVTIPADFLETGEEDQDIDEIIAEAKDSGIKEVIENEDGSLTYKMSKSTHKELMKAIRQGIEESMDDMINDEDFASIQDITTNKSFSEFTMIVDKEPFENSMDSFAVLGIIFGSMYYQLFDGIDVDDYEVLVQFEDANTGEIFNEATYPDAFDL